MEGCGSDDPQKISEVEAVTTIVIVVVFTQSSYIRILMHKVMVLEDGIFRNNYIRKSQGPLMRLIPFSQAPEMITLSTM